MFRTSDLLAAMSEVRVAGQDKIDGREAFRIEAKLWGNQEVKLWIDKAQYLILQSSRSVFFGGQRIELTVNFKPRLNADIPPEKLSLKVPGDDVKAPQPSRVTTSSASSAPTLGLRQEFGWSLTQSSNARSTAAKRKDAEDDVVRVDTDLVVASVLVTDSDGKVVTGLTKDDFVVQEDDSLQEIASFSLGNSKDVPRSIVLIIDYSGSQLPYIQTSIEAARMLVDKLNPKDRMAVVTDDVNLLVDFTNDKDLLKSRLDGLRQRALSGALGASDQYDALMAT
ncbi:MAG: VWA domain-containing protein, partial [Pyrinomonadaceae bacterium]